MPNKRNITVGAKVDREYASGLKAVAESRNESLGSYVREVLRVNDKLNEISFLYDIEPMEVAEGVERLLESGKLTVKNGELQ